MTLVVDANVACKWLVEEDDGGGAASALLESGERLIAPDLAVAETCNVLWKKLRLGAVTPEQAAAAAVDLLELYDELTPCADLAERAIQIAISLDHPAYDCFYLALAEREKAHFVTADGRLLERVARTPWRRRMMRLGA